jgi:hypothetical protein
MRHGRRLRVLGPLAGALAIATTAAAPAHAVDFSVTNLNDAGPGSLRQALTDAAAPGPDRVLFAPELSGKIVLTSDELDVAGGTEVVGPGAARLTVSGNGQFRVFHVGGLPTEPVTISGLTIADGLSMAGGGGIASGGPVIVSKVVLTGNTALGAGGGIANSGALTVLDSTVVGNRVLGIGGGGISATGTTLTIERSTITNNTAETGTGGGVWHNIAAADPATIADSTISGNSAAMTGGGIQLDTVARLSNNILANNTAPSRPDVGVTNGAPSVEASFNLVEQPADAPINFGGSNLTGIDPKLGPLADNGGPTPTLALLKGSPALDKGLSTGKGDQRGATRPYDLKKTPKAAGGNSADIGAYERALCGNALVTVVGTPGKDKLAGGKGKDGILGLGGKDTLKGKKGNDGLCGGGGKDTLRGGPGKDTLLGQGGKDLLVGGGGKDKLEGGGGKDRERP